MTDEVKSEQSAQPKKRVFGQTFWMLNCIEMFERLAYFGIRAVAPIYIMQATEPGGLHLTALDKGWIYAWWAILQSWLPMFTGGIADRYGYKRVLAGSISLNAIGYLMMAYMHSYHGFFAGILVLAAGTAFFKPALQGSIAQGLSKKNSSMGWGIFYWVVNIGAMIAPILATLVLGKPHSAEGWKNLFLISSGYTACNLFLLFTFKDVPSGADKSQSLMKVFAVTIENIWPYWFVDGKFHPMRGISGIVCVVAGLFLVIIDIEQLGENQWMLGVGLIVIGSVLATWLDGGKYTLQMRLPAFILIMSCFWMMMYQLWDLHPNFIEDWVDSADTIAFVPFESWKEYGDRGLLRVPQQIMLTFYNAFLIILLVIPISYIVRKMRTLSAMLIGMGMATIGVLIAGLTDSGLVLILGITCFSLGEMLTGPKKNQYLGLIAPPGKKGLYLGYVNIPIGVGVGLGSLIAGVVYDNYGEKAGLALEELAKRTELVATASQMTDWSDSLDKIPKLIKIQRKDAFAKAKEQLAIEDDKVAAETLINLFRNDRGQIDNICLHYLALDDEYRDKVKDNLVDALGKLNDADEDVIKVIDVAEQADLDKRITLGEDLKSSKIALEEIGLSDLIDLLPKAIGRTRAEAFPLVCEKFNTKGSEKGGVEVQDSIVIDRLWDKMKEQKSVLNNLALEYLAQATPLVRDAVAKMEYKNSIEDLDERVKELKSRIGIGRTKSFTALSAALGVGAEQVNAALAEVKVSTGSIDDAAYVFLINMAHQRFMAVARKDWTRDLDLLKKLITDDENAKVVVLAEIDDDPWYVGCFKGIIGIFGSDENELKVDEDGVNYTKLAGKQELIQKALNLTNWSNSPEEAKRILRLNPFEARSMVAAEVDKSPLKTTRMLYDKYDPQYKVWIPFASIGVLAAIALAIFGQMAKRWKDMNA